MSDGSEAGDASVSQYSKARTTAGLKLPPIAGAQGNITGRSQRSGTSAQKKKKKVPTIQEEEESSGGEESDDIPEAGNGVDPFRPKVRRIDRDSYESEESSEGEEEDAIGKIGSFINPLAVTNLMKKKPEKKENKNQGKNKITRVTEDDLNQAAQPAELDVMKMGGNPNFENYSELFQNLTLLTPVKTQYDILSVIITYDSSRVVTVTKENDVHCVIKQYNLHDNNKLTFEEHYYGTYLKMKEVEQNDKGNLFHVCYMDDGVFKIRIFNKDEPADKDDQNKGFNINEVLGLNNYTIPVAGFPDPYITSCFIDNDRIFVNLFHNVELKHYQFIYSIKENAIVSPEIVTK